MPTNNATMNDLLKDLMTRAGRVRQKFEENSMHASINGAIATAGDDIRRAQIVTHAIELLEFAQYSDRQTIPQVLDLLYDNAQHIECLTPEGEKLLDCTSNALVLCDTLIHDPRGD